jgi:hypothetical protein
MPHTNALSPQMAPTASHDYLCCPLRVPAAYLGLLNFVASSKKYLREALHPTEYEARTFLGEGGGRLPLVWSCVVTALGSRSPWGYSSSRGSFTLLRLLLQRMISTGIQLSGGCHAMPSYVYGCGPFCEWNSRHSSLLGLMAEAMGRLIVGRRKY